MTRFIFAVLALSIFATLASAQSNTGRLVGTVSDASGVIPGATVVAKDNQTGKERTVVASDDGSFTIPQLEVGNYTVTVTAPGHKTFTATDLKIDVGKDYSLNPTLEVGEINESITVIAGADVINATTGELSNTVSPRQIQELPLNGRDPTALITLQAGTASNGAQNTSVNGQRPTFTNITRDGINIQDNHIRANASDFSVERPNVDDVIEFTFTSQNASADKGYGASQVQFVTPRGQNEFHGAAFIYNRNSEFSANRFFNNATGTPKPFLNRNQLGGKISGPVISNKLFFFGFYEALRLRTQESVIRTILTPSARQGTFTYIDNAGVTRSVNIFTLLNNPTVPGINPAIQSRILANVPSVGNSVDVGDQRNTTGLRFLQRDNTDSDKYTTRLDYDINPQHTLNLVFSYTDERVNDRGDVDRNAPNGGGGGFGSVPIVIQPSNRIFNSTAYRWSPSPNFTNEARFGFFFSDPDFVRTAPLPAFKLSSATSLGTLPLINNPEINIEPQGRTTRNYTFQDNADYLWGNHSFRFGGLAQIITDNTFAAFDVVPRYQLSTSPNTPALTASQFPGGISAGQLGTANGLLALLGGIVSASSQNFNPTSRDSGFVTGQPAAFRYRFDTYSLYAADQWRVSPSLTLNLGLRYEVITPLREVNGLAIEPVIPEGLSVTEAVLDPNGRVDFINGFGNDKLHRTDKNNFAPVVSFAYAPSFKNKFLGAVFGDGRTVIRGGFRMSYVNDEILRSQDSSQQSNVGLSTTVTNNSLNERLGGTLTPVVRPTFRLPLTFRENNLATNNFAPILAIDPNYQIARSNEYNFGIQREIGYQTAIEVRYVGGYSNNLPRGLDINNLDMINNGFLADFIRARSNLLRFGAAGCTAAQAAATGCQQLTVFPRFGAGGALTNATIINSIRAGEPQALLLTYIQNNLQGSVPLRVNENGGTVSVLENGGRYNYNSLQTEIRRRFSGGLYFQANYTFQKTLTNATGTDQFKFNTNLDNSRPELEYARADYDQTHVFNFNGIYELPFGRGKRFFTDAGPWLNRLLGGFQVTGIVNVASGAPYTFVDVRGTLNRASRSGRQTPQTSLTTDQIKDLVGIFRTPCGVFFINPSVLNLNLATCSGTGRAAEGFGSTPFPGQVFFNNGPGETGSLGRAFINGPTIFNVDASLIKNIQISEGVRFQIRAEAFNLLNRTNFFAGAAQSGTGSIFDINSQNFGRVVTTFSPRIIQFAGRLEF